MKKNIKLLMAIRGQGLFQRDLAQMVNTSESTVSEVVRGNRKLDLARQIRWAKALGRKREELF